MSTDPIAGLRDDLDVLGPALAAWSARTGHGTAAHRRAASKAIDAVDSMLRQLYLIRGRLAGLRRVPELPRFACYVTE